MVPAGATMVTSPTVSRTSSNKPHNYHEQSQIDQTLRLREVLKTLPPFVKDYFRAMEPKSSARTRINYAYDIRVFFHFLMENNPVYKNYTIDRFTPQDLENLEPRAEAGARRPCGAEGILRQRRHAALRLLPLPESH